jgi:hypothetical protein
MSLDVYLCTATECPNCGHHIGDGSEIYWANITHNLSGMAHAAGIYEACWRPDELVNPEQAKEVRELENQKQWTDARALRERFPNKPRASDLIPVLRAGLADLKARPDHFKQFNAPNGWGLHEHFVPWLEKYLAACEEHPTASVRVSR